MIKKVAVVLSTFFLAFFILLVSVLHAATPDFTVSATPTIMPKAPTQGKENAKTQIDYVIAYPGPILPDSPLWPVKALRDKLWLFFTFNDSKKVELNLLFADKRLAASKILFERDKPELAFSTLTKGEKYLEEASKIAESEKNKNTDTASINSKLANASLKHREVIEDIVKIAPEDVKPRVIQIESYSGDVYAKSRDALMSKGLPVPPNPFNGS
jgi:hypothetical protein